MSPLPSRHRTSTRRPTSLALAIAAFAALWLARPDTARAYPTFARANGVSCSTCHVAFPRRNEFGDAFRKAGYRFPREPMADVAAHTDAASLEGGDELDEGLDELPAPPPSVLTPIDMQGNSLFAGSLPPLWVFSVVGQIAAQATNDPEVEPAFGLGTPSLKLLFGAPLSEHISLLGNWSVRAPPSEYFLHIARILDRPELNVLVGRFEQTKTLFRSNEALLSPYRLNTSAINGHVVAEPRGGLEVNGILGRRGFYAAGVVQEDDLGPSFHGYYHLSYRFGGLDFFGEPADLDLDAEPSWLDDLSLTLGTWGHGGRVGDPGQAARAEIRRAGVDAKLQWRRLGVWSGVMLGLDRNLRVRRDSPAVVGFAEASVWITEWLLGLYVYQWQDTATERRLSQLHEAGVILLPLENVRLRLLGAITDDNVDNEIAELQLVVGI